MNSSIFTICEFNNLMDMTEEQVRRCLVEAKENAQGSVFKNCMASLIKNAQGDMEELTLLLDEAGQSDQEMVKEYSDELAKIKAIVSLIYEVKDEKKEFDEEKQDAEVLVFCKSEKGKNVFVNSLDKDKGFKDVKNKKDCLTLLGELNRGEHYFYDETKEKRLNDIDYLREKKRYQARLFYLSENVDGTLYNFVFEALVKKKDKLTVEEYRAIERKGLFYIEMFKKMSNQERLDEIKEAQEIVKNLGEYQMEEQA